MACPSLRKRGGLVIANPKGEAIQTRHNALDCFASLAMTLEPSSLRGAKRRSNPDGKGPPLDCFASLAMTGGTVVIARSKATKQSRRGRSFTGLLRSARNDGRNCRHCEEQSDEAIQTGKALPSSTLRVEPIASPALRACSKTLRDATLRCDPGALRGWETPAEGGSGGRKSGARGKAFPPPIPLAEILNRL
jgi:hypothetical protein